MATYILFWNPDISSYTMERFQDDFENKECVGNWSFHEHEKVKWKDRFYMVRCGKGKTGIVMYGIILSECYEDDDWSPKKRGNIYYADIESIVTINPESDAQLLTPESLTERLPDFNWFGGHSGRRLSLEYAQKLDKIWAEYLISNPKLFDSGEAFFDSYYFEPTRAMESVIYKTVPRYCEICGFEYKKYFSKEEIKKYKVERFPVSFISSSRLNRVFFSICHNCKRLPEGLLIDKLSD